MIRLKENIFVEEDTSKNCANYPNGRYESYNHCDEDFSRNVTPPGLIPIWSVSKRENVTTKLYIKNITNSKYDYHDLMDGTQKSECLMPCKTISIESRQLSEIMSQTKTSFIELTFSQDIVVSKTSFVKFSFVNFLSGLGGCMGLWLGLRFLQAIEIGINCIRSNK